MAKKLIFLFLSLLSSITICAQLGMEEGYAMLESQDYDNAANFFTGILDEEPNNKTARICFGRAVGLRGDHDEALSVFKSLEENYPSDIEVELNLAEAYMWKQNYQEAYQIYQDLLEVDSNHYVVNLGYANANASLNNSEEALKYINKTIAIDSSQKGAFISKKYILLALADQKRKDWEYEQSHQYLNEVEALFPNDKDAVLNRATVYLSQKDVESATKVFSKLYSENIKPLDGLLGLSYTALLKGKKKQSLQYAQQALSYTIQHELPNDQYLRAAVNEINALVNAKQNKKANKRLKELERAFPNEPSVLLTKARVKVWQREPSKGLELYQSLRGLFPDSFEWNMGVAEAYRSMGKNKVAVSYIDSALTIIPRQPDAMSLLEELDFESKTLIVLGGNISDDIGGNAASLGKVIVEYKKGDAHTFYGSYANRNAKQKVEVLGSTQQTLIIGDRWAISPTLRLDGALGFVKGSSLEGNPTSHLLDIGLQKTVFKNHNLGLKYSREAHNYTVDLIDSGIIMDHIVTNYSFQSNIGIGTYNQYIKTYQSDANQRDLLYSSIYYSFNHLPIVKLGASGSMLKYEFKAADLYFSPSILKTGELFAELSNPDVYKGRMSYRVMLAIGLQKIEELPTQTTRRVDASISYKFSRAVQLEASYMNSNAADSNAVGFSYSNFGLNLRIKL